MLRIGDIKLHNGLILAPLAGITDSSFRKICKSFGVELVFTEMVSSEGIKRKTGRTIKYLYFNEVERPIGIQIFGSNAESMKEAARIIETDFHPDVIDINLGCPVKKVTKTGAGAALLKDLRKLEGIVKGVVSSVNIPVSAKIRLGWDKNNSIKVSKVLEDCGISFLIVHARRAKDGYNIKADWSVFERIKRNITIPLVANGDIEKPDDATYLLNEIGVNAIMIGRGAIGRPWVFGKMKDFIKHGRCSAEPTLHERIKVFLRQIELMEESIDEERTVRRIKKQISYYLKGMPETKNKTHEILTTKRLDKMVSLISGLISNTYIAGSRRLYPV